MCPAMQSSCQWFLIPYEQHFQTCLALPHFVNYAFLLRLKAIPCLRSSALLEGLNAELPTYMATADGVSVSTLVGKQQWWKNHENELPHLSTACILAFLVQPSSAAAEGCFTLVK